LFGQMPCGRVSSPRSNASCSTAAGSRPNSRPAWRCSISSRDSTTLTAATRRSTIHRRSTTKGVIQQRLVSAGQHRLPKRGRSDCRRGFVHPGDRRERYGEKRSNREVRYPGKRQELVGGYGLTDLSSPSTHSIYPRRSTQSVAQRFGFVKCRRVVEIPCNFFSPCLRAV
jgi:hypothetical protein